MVDIKNSFITNDNGECFTTGCDNCMGKIELTLADFKPKPVRHPHANQIIKLVNNWVRTLQCINVKLDVGLR